MMAAPELVTVETVPAAVDSDLLRRTVRWPVDGPRRARRPVRAERGAAAYPRRDMLFDSPEMHW